MAATGQPTMNADSQRGTKSARKPILKKVTTALTMNTMMAVITIGKTILALPSMIRLRGLVRIEPKALVGSRGGSMIPTGPELTVSSTALRLRSTPLNHAGARSR